MRFEEGRFYLLVIKSGFVLVGQFEQSEDALFLRVVGKAAKIRWWGTTAGLGELAEKGPLDATKLDVEATEYVNKLEISHVIRCSDAWKKWGAA